LNIANQIAADFRAKGKLSRSRERHFDLQARHPKSGKPELEIRMSSIVRPYHPSLLVRAGVLALVALAGSIVPALALSEKEIVPLKAGGHVILMRQSQHGGKDWRRGPANHSGLGCTLQ
jgi:hypothetical protein